MTRVKAASAAFAVLAAGSLVAACTTKDNGGAFSGPPPSSGPPAALDPAAAGLLPPAIQAGRSLRAGVDPTTPPYAFLQGGSVQGVDEDVLQAVATQLGVKVTVVPGAAASSVDLMLPGPPDGTGTHPPAGEVVAFLHIGFSTVVKAGASSACTGPVAVTPLVPAEFPGCPGGRVSVNGIADAVAALQQGRVNAIAADDASAAYAVQTGKGLQRSRVTAAASVPVGFVLPAGSALEPALQAAVNAVMASPTYRQILTTWAIPAPTAPGTSTP